MHMRWAGVRRSKAFSDGTSERPLALALEELWGLITLAQDDAALVPLLDSRAIEVRCRRDYCINQEKKSRKMAVTLQVPQLSSGASLIGLILITVLKPLRPVAAGFVP